MAPRRVRVTARAERRLRDIAEWTRDRWGPAQAATYVADLRAAFDRIAEGSLRGRDARAAWGERVRIGLLFARVGSHYVLFLERPGEVEVVNVLHEAMDLPRRARGYGGRVRPVAGTFLAFGGGRWVNLRFAENHPPYGSLHEAVDQAGHRGSLPERHGGSAMGIHSVALSDEEEATVGGLVASGLFPDAAGALRAGLAAGLKALEGEAARAAFVARINAAYDEAKAGARAPGTWEEVQARVLRRARGE